MPYPSRRACLLALCLALLPCLGGPAHAQHVRTTIFSGADASTTVFWDASWGTATGDDVLFLEGQNRDKLPLQTTPSPSGSRSGLLEYRHIPGGTFNLFVARPGWESFDASRMDSLVLFISGPAPVPGGELPRIGLEDVQNRKSALVAMPVAEHLVPDPEASGFTAESATNVRLSFSYVPILPADQVRPGYPENLTITFSAAPLDTSVAAIGVPAVPARFRVDAESAGQLSFRFRDVDGDGTLSAESEYIEVLTPEAEGSTRLRATWRIEPDLAGVVGTPQPPGAGDVYRLVYAVQPALDASAATWQRVSIPLAAFTPLDGFDIRSVKTVRFSNGGFTAATRTVWFDSLFVTGISTDTRPVGTPEDVVSRAGDRSVVLHWTPRTEENLGGYHVYRATNAAGPFTRVTGNPVTIPHFTDFAVENGVTHHYQVTAANTAGMESPPSVTVVAAPSAFSDDEAFLDYVQHLAFDYFWYEANPENGLVRDRSRPGAAASVAAVGFGLSALTVGIDRGWITAEQGRERVLRTLQTFWQGRQGPEATGTVGYKGFFYHFLGMETATRAGTSELSTIDTALLLGGVLHARSYFSGDDPASAGIRALADSIYLRVDWAWAQARPPRISHGWSPESGYIPYDYVGYNEAQILYLLALASPTHPVESSAWDAYTAGYEGRWQTHYGYTFLTFPPLFGHQYTQVWYDLRYWIDPLAIGEMDYFANSGEATLAQREYAIANPEGWAGYGANFWGITASDGPEGYRARGAAPEMNDNGTIAPTAVGGSVPFAPEETIAALRHMYDTYRTQLWGHYGFKDAINPTQSWVATDYIGIDQGPILLMIENYRSGAVWNAFMSNPEAAHGLERAGLYRRIVDAVDSTGAPATRLERIYPSPFRARTTVRYNLAQPGKVTLTAYDALGRRVATLVDGVQPAGPHEAVFNAAGLAPGIYFFVLDTAGSRETAAAVLVR